MTTPAGAWVLISGQWVRGGNAPIPAPVSTARFFGDPGPNKVLTGSTVYTGSAGIADGLAWLNQQTGVNHLLARRYSTDLWSRSTIVSDRAAGRIPFPSFKLNATTSNAAAIIAGTRDADLAAEARWAAAQGYPILCSFYHEPEDNWSSDAAAAQFRAIFRRIVTVFRNNGATNVNWLPILSAPYTFRGNGGEAQRGPWYKWDPDWMGTQSGSNGRATTTDWYTGSSAVLNMYGFDQYCPLIGTTGYAEFSAHLGTALSKMTGDGRTILPWVVPEMGTKNVASGLPSDGWGGYYTRAFQYMRDNLGVGFISYNTDGNNFANGPDAAARLAGYETALGSESAYLVTTRPL